MSLLLLFATASADDQTLSLTLAHSGATIYTPRLALTSSVTWTTTAGFNYVNISETPSTGDNTAKKYWTDLAINDQIRFQRVGSATASISFSVNGRFVADSKSVFTAKRWNGSWSSEQTLTYTAAPANQTVSLALAHSGVTHYSPTIEAGDRNLLLNLKDSGFTAYQPTIGLGDVSLNLNAVASQFTAYSPTIQTGQSNLILNLKDSGFTAYAPTFQPGDVTVSLTLKESGLTIYAPRFALTSSVTWTTTAGFNYVNVTETPATGDNTAKKYWTDLAVNDQIRFQRVGSATASVSFSANGRFVADAKTVFTAKRWNGSWSSEQTLTYTVGSSQQTISLALAHSGVTYYSPTIQAGDVTVSLALKDSGLSIYPPTLFQANTPQTASLALAYSGVTHYAPTLRTRTNLSLGLKDSSATAYPVVFGLTSSVTWTTTAGFNYVNITETPASGNNTAKQYWTDLDVGHQIRFKRVGSASTSISFSANGRFVGDITSVFTARRWNGTWSSDQTLTYNATGVTVSPGVGAITYTGIQPTVAWSKYATWVVDPGVGQITYTGIQPPVLLRDGSIYAFLGFRASTLQFFSPTIVSGAELIELPLKASDLTLYSPSFSSPINVFLNLKPSSFETFEINPVVGPQQIFLGFRASTLIHFEIAFPEFPVRTVTLKRVTLDGVSLDVVELTRKHYDPFY